MNLFIETPQRTADRRRWAQSECACETISERAVPGWCDEIAGPAPDRSGDHRSLRSRLFGRAGVRVSPHERAHREAQAPEQVEMRDGELYSVAQESYREELAYDRHRARCRRAARICRALLLLIGIPMALCLVFTASYALTCILNGATPSEVVELLSGLFNRITGFIRAAT